jgi:hypothetical protein
MTGDQIGAYFGYSVASGDLNCDGLDDVIIGAPMWTNYEVMGKFETGKVFVVYQNQQVDHFIIVFICPRFSQSVEKDFRKKICFMFNSTSK